jgi:hypothetical protein
MPRLQIESGSALIAPPEKALLDVMYLARGPFHASGSRRCGCRTSTAKPATLIRMASGHGARLEAAARELARWIRRDNAREGSPPPDGAGQPVERRSNLAREYLQMYVLRLIYDAGGSTDLAFV